MFYNDDEHSDMPTTERIPVALMEPFLNKGHILFTNTVITILIITLVRPWQHIYWKIQRTCVEQ